MKKIAIVSIGYIWFPCEPGPSRFYYLAKIFSEMGYDVDIVTSNFQHFKKEYRDIEMIRQQHYPFNIIFIDVPKYKKNLDGRRIYSNAVAKKKIVRYFKKYGKQYDAVYCTIPANNIAAGVSEYCKNNDIPFIADIEDLWPEAMTMAFNVPIINKIVFYPFKHDAEIVYKNAKAVIGTSDEYTDRAFKRRARNIPNETVYVGCDLEKFDKGVEEFSPKISKDKNEFWISYAGSIGTSYDIKTMIKAAAILEKKGILLIRFKIMGTGPLLEEMLLLAEKLQCSNVDIMGYIEYPKMAAYLSLSDVTVNSFVKGAPQSIVNKIGDYLASESAMINTLENDEFIKLVEKEQFGINIEPENAEMLSNAILELYSDRDLRERLAVNARRCAEIKFDVAVSYRRIVNIVKEQIDGKVN